MYLHFAIRILLLITHNTHCAFYRVQSLCLILLHYPSQICPTNFTLFSYFSDTFNSISINFIHKFIIIFFLHIYYLLISFVFFSQFPIQFSILLNFINFETCVKWYRTRYFKIDINPCTLAIYKRYFFSSNTIFAKSFFNVLF